ncbi:VanZ family protein [Symbioplanes lichenis]|uniref:VanZ family protein n=1 Tax=Symbioplanes lichenis TaxID=1629072 RepID=UPI0027397419|nr:VanZ family protein [Actinoplanes lichenis]
MGAAWRDHGLTVLLAVLVLPGLGLLAYRWRRHKASRRNALAEIGLVLGTLPWLVMLFTPQPADRSLQLVPLRDLVSWGSTGTGTAIAQTAGNLLVLAAVGFFAPIRFVAVATLTRVLAVAAALAVVIEALQWLLMIGRVSSIDDVLVNTLGAGLAALLSRRWWRIRERTSFHILNAR